MPLAAPRSSPALAPSTPTRVSHADGCGPRWEVGRAEGRRRGAHAERTPFLGLHILNSVFTLWGRKVYWQLLVFPCMSEPALPALGGADTN